MIEVLIKEVQITASLAYRHVFPDVIASISSGKLDVNKVITKKIELDHVVEYGLELLVRDKSHAKILIEMT
jgi:(R,R)-butanediol dehydrogenase / meso-butanediol dehydrogenase / diacetyl reductase